MKIFATYFRMFISFELWLFQIKFHHVNILK
jgi:hypothetical protein